MRTITITNQKGGVGKTTTAEAFAVILHQRGYRTLVVDMDGQGNLSQRLGADTKSKPLTRDIIETPDLTVAAIQHTPYCDIISSNEQIAALDTKLSGDRIEFRLRDALAKVSEYYDYAIIDTAPSSNIRLVNAFIAADEIISPVKGGDTHSAQGVVRTAEIVNNIRRFRPELTYRGAFITMFKKQRGNQIFLRDSLLPELSERYGVPLFQTTVRDTVDADNAVAWGTSIIDAPRQSALLSDYNSLIDEYLRVSPPKGNPA